MTIPGVGVESVRYEEGDSWNREYAQQALDLLESVYHIPRRKVRFHVI